MPIYQYRCDSNGRTVEIKHGINVDLTTWGEVCYAAQITMGDTDFLAPVRRIISAPALALPVGNSALKNMGFTKLVKRESGVYENVTHSDGEARYMRAGDPSSVPRFKDKITD
ncbi:MAG: zinc ribbon domain-containing protein [Gammaproteobacteria bacterium]